MLEFIILLFLGIFIILYRKNPGENVYKFFITTASEAYEKYAPYSFKTVRAKAKELGFEKISLLVDIDNLKALSLY